MDDDLPVPRDGKLEGWRHLPGTRITGKLDAPDACPFCQTEAHAVPGGMLGQATAAGASPEPWQEVARCPQCKAHLVRIPGDPWTGTVPH